MSSNGVTTNTLARLLEEEELDDQTFVDLTHDSLDLRGKRFSNCTFDGMNLREVQLVECVFTDCRFVRCDLSMARLLDCGLREVTFEHTKLMGVDWSVARDLVFDVAFHTCVLSYGSFFKRRMRDAKLVDCVAHETDFSAADLTGADFTGTDLRDARFEKTDLTRADLSTARDYRIRPGENTLKNTRFSMEAALEVVAELGIIVD